MLSSKGMRGALQVRSRGPGRGAVARSNLKVAGSFLQNLFQASQKGTRSAKDAVMGKLLGSIEGTSRGTKMSKEQRVEILGHLGALKELSGGDDSAVDVGLLDGTWRLVWTTEKEILGIIKEGGIASWFGTAAGDVLQVIDLEGGRLQNCIEFPPVGAFLVDSSIQVRGL